MAFSTLLFLIPFLARIVEAQNDWSVPCFSGSCQYDLPASNGSASGSLKIWGGVDTISDITTAAGWEILGCSPDALSQDIRLVCNSSDTAAVGCDHLYQNSGAEGKIVRLPQNCGKSAFARVAKAWVPEDQSIPSSISTRLVHRATRPEVKALTLDTNFGAIDTSKAGVINLAIVGANVPGVDPTIVNSASGLSARSGRLYERGLTDFIGNAVDSIKKLDTFNVNKNKALPPIDVDKSINLFKKELSCPPVSAAVSVDADAKAHAVVTLGVVASGTVVPPKVKAFSLVAGLTADLTGSIDLNADVAGTLDSGKIKIFEVGIPGLDFPGVLSIGPSFVVNAEAKASLDLNVDMTVGLNYHISDAQLTFPPNGKKSGGSFNIGDTPLTLSASPSVKATGSVEAHIIPTLNLGISALANVVGANVFLDLDTSAKMSLTLEAGADASVTVSKAKRANIPTDVPAPVPPNFYSTKSPGASKATSSVKAATTKASTVKAVSTKAATTKASTAKAPTSTKASGVTTTTSTDTSFGGCFDITAGLSVNAGADADFFGLFNAGTQVPLFTKNFQLFKKCFGDQPARRSLAWIGGSTLERRAFERRALSCPKAGVEAAIPVTKGNIAASSIKAA